MGAKVLYTLLVVIPVSVVFVIATEVGEVVAMTEFPDASTQVAAARMRMW